MSHSKTPIHTRIPDRPLIDRVTNEWKHKSEYQEFYKKYEEDDYGQFITPSTRRGQSTPRIFRRPLRFVLGYIIVVSFMLYVYTQWIYPKEAKEFKLDMALQFATVHAPSMGLNRPLDFGPSLTLLQYLDSKNRPGATSQSPKRLIFIGDVHGCKEELVRLLEKVEFNQATDHIIFTGDLVTKGPDSAGVIDLARSYGASSVRGNHEDRLLLAYSALHDIRGAPNLPITKEAEGSSPRPNVPPPPQEDVLRGSKDHLALAEALTTEQMEWLRNLPVILYVGRIGKDKTDYCVTHAGLAPGVPLDKQDASQVMNMRTIDVVTRVPSEKKEGQSWFDVWNHFQKHALIEEKRMVVVYGHDASQGMQIKPYSKGLDTGCVKGGKLTALIVNEKGKEKTVSVKCSVDYTKAKKK